MAAFKNIGIIAHDNYGAREIFTKIYFDHPDLKITLFVTTGLYYRKSYFQSILKMLREASFIFCFIRFLEGVFFKIKGDTLVKRAKSFGVDLIYTSDINSDEIHQIIGSRNIELLVSTFTMHILKKKTIELPKFSTIGTHPSILPDYRGLEVFFWALANRETKSGVSVFFVDQKIDSGRVFVQEEFDIVKAETVESIYKKLSEIAARLLSQAISQLKNEQTLSFFPNSTQNRYFPMPTRESFRSFIKSGHKWFG